MSTWQHASTDADGAYGPGIASIDAFFTGDDEPAHNFLFKLADRSAHAFFARRIFRFADQCRNDFVTNLAQLVLAVHLVGDGIGLRNC